MTELKRTRILNEITQAELAEEAGMSQARIAQMERAEHLCTDKVKAALDRLVKARSKQSR